MALLLVAAAAAQDPKVSKVVAADEEEATKALEEDPRDKRDWIYRNPYTGSIDAVVAGGSTHPAQVSLHSN